MTKSECLRKTAAENLENGGSRLSSPVNRPGTAGFPGSCLLNGQFVFRSVRFGIEFLLVTHALHSRHDDAIRAFQALEYHPPAVVCLPADLHVFLHSLIFLVDDPPKALSLIRLQRLFID